MTAPHAANAPRLEADWLVAASTQSVFKALERGGFRARAVGGSVRNALLKLPVSDIDLATDAPPDDVLRLAAAAGFKIIPTGLAHGTVTVIAQSQPFEITTLRRDVATDGRHAEVAFTTDWVADARRRDFTINALYCDADGTIFDPLGGVQDLDPVRIRFIGDARRRIEEDYLRILRFFRFTAVYTAGGVVDADGLAACTALRDGLARISGERIQAELLKLLVAPHAGAVTAALVASGVLRALVDAEPHASDLARLIAIEERLGLTPDPVRRLAALAVVTSTDASALDRRLKLSAKDRGRLNCSAAHAGELSPQLDERQLRVCAYRWGMPSYEDAALHGWARSGAGVDDAGWFGVASLASRFTPPEFPISGRDLVALGYPAGPGVGETLERLEAGWIAGGFQLDRNELIALARAALPPVQS